VVLNRIMTAFSDVLIFGIAKESRALVSMLEAVEYMCTGMKVLTIVHEVREGSYLGSELCGKYQAKDINRARLYMIDVSRRHNCMVFKDVQLACEVAVQMIQEKYSRSRDTRFSTLNNILWRFLGSESFERRCRKALRGGSPSTHHRRRRTPSGSELRNSPTSLLDMQHIRETVLEDVKSRGQKRHTLALSPTSSPKNAASKKHNFLFSWTDTPHQLQRASLTPPPSKVGRSRRKDDSSEGANDVFEFTKNSHSHEKIEVVKSRSSREPKSRPNITTETEKDKEQGRKSEHEIRLEGSHIANRVIREMYRHLVQDYNKEYKVTRIIGRMDQKKKESSRDTKRNKFRRMRSKRQMKSFATLPHYQRQDSSKSLDVDSNLNSSKSPSNGERHSVQTGSSIKEPGKMKLLKKSLFKRAFRTLPLEDLPEIPGPEPSPKQKKCRLPARVSRLIKTYEIGYSKQSSLDSVAGKVSRVESPNSVASHNVEKIEAKYAASHDNNSTIATNNFGGDDAEEQSSPAYALNIDGNPPSYAIVSKSNLPSLSEASIPVGTTKPLTKAQDSKSPKKIRQNPLVSHKTPRINFDSNQNLQISGTAVDGKTERTQATPVRGSPRKHEKSLSVDIRDEDRTSPSEISPELKGTVRGIDPSNGIASSNKTGERNSSICMGLKDKKKADIQRSSSKKTPGERVFSLEPLMESFERLWQIWGGLLAPTLIKSSQNGSNGMRTTTCDASLLSEFLTYVFLEAYTSNEGDDDAAAAEPYPILSPENATSSAKTPSPRSWKAKQQEKRCVCVVLSESLCVFLDTNQRLR